jgi:uncharacterized RmlC-like cupin family protein
MAKIIRGQKAPVIENYEPPLDIHRGIYSKTVGDTKLTMSHVYIPPAGRNQRHYHVKCDAYHYIAKGRIRCFVGPDNDIEEIDAKQGDFVFVPQGVIHGLMNLSDTDFAEIVAGYGGVAGSDEAETIKVESRWDE